MAEPEPTILDYAQPSRQSRRPLITGFQLLLGICFWSAIFLGVATFLQMAHRPYSPQYRQYLTNLEAKQAAQPSYIPPPYVGPRMTPATIWDYATTYGSIALAGIGLVSAAGRWWRYRGRVG